MKKKHIALIVMGCCILGVASRLLRGKSMPQGGVAPSPANATTITTKVQKKPFESSIQKEGTLTIENEQKMKFTLNERVTSVTVAEGERVAKNQTLATIQATSVHNGVKEANRRLNDATGKRDDFARDFQDAVVQRATKQEQDLQTEIEQKVRAHELLAPHHRAQVLEQQSVIAETEKQFETIKQSLQGAVNTSTYTDEDRVKKKLIEHRQIIEKEYTSLEDYVQSMSDIFKELDIILEVNEGKFEYDVHFGANTPALKAEVRRDGLFAYSDWKKLKERVDALRNHDQHNTLLAVIVDSQKLNNDFIAIIDKLLTLTDESTIYGELTNNRLDEYRKSFRNHKNTIEEYNTAISVHKETISEYINTQGTIEEKIRHDLRLDQGLDSLKLKQAQLVVDTETKKLANLQQTHTEEIAQSKRDIEALRADFRLLVQKNKDITTLATNPDYKILQQSVEQAQESLQEASKKYDSYVLKAPFDGVVASMQMRVGDIADSDEVYITLSNPDIVSITVPVNQSELTKIDKGMLASVKLDAYDDVMLTGQVVAVDTVDAQGGVAFQAKILITNHTNKKMYSGMKAKVSLHVQTLPASLVIPFTAVASDPDGAKYVTRVNGSTQEKVYIEVGYTDGRHYQVTSGLAEGDTILEIDYAAAQSAGQKNKNDDEYGSMGGGIGGAEMMMY